MPGLPTCNLKSSKSKNVTCSTTNQKWLSNPVSPWSTINIQRLKLKLQNHENKDFVLNIIDGFANGFDTKVQNTRMQKHKVNLTEHESFNKLLLKNWKRFSFWTLWPDFERHYDHTLANLIGCPLETSHRKENSWRTLFSVSTVAAYNSGYQAFLKYSCKNNLCQNVLESTLMQFVTYCFDFLSLSY